MGSVAAVAKTFTFQGRAFWNTIHSSQVCGDRSSHGAGDEATSDADAAGGTVLTDSGLLQMGAWLAGGACLGVDDCALAPKLHHLVVAGKHYKGFEVRMCPDVQAGRTKRGAGIAFCLFPSRMNPSCVKPTSDACAFSVFLTPAPPELPCSISRRRGRRALLIVTNQKDQEQRAP